MSTSTVTLADLPGLDCGLCGVRTCRALAERLTEEPTLLQRCIPLASDRFRGRPVPTAPAPTAGVPAAGVPAALAGAASAPAALCGGCPEAGPVIPAAASGAGWADTLGRRIDFYLEHFPEDPGPREVILPHNPMITRELEVTPGDILIGRPLGMSCGCPITHCGVVREVDPRTGVIVWCVTGPLDPRRQGFKDLGYYIAEAYEGIVAATAVEVTIGVRYFFQPRMCMLQWRHSGLVNFVNRIGDGTLQVRLEGLWIG